MRLRSGVDRGAAMTPDDDGLRPMPTVKGLCSVCFSWYLDPDEKQREMRDAMLVSPTGLVHHAESEITCCGKDATNWWWRV